MRAVLSSLAALLIAGCHQSNAGDNVRASYDTSADAIDRQAAQQPTAAAQKIYQARADAIREEGQDRQKGLQGREPSSGPGAAASGAK